MIKNEQASSVEFFPKFFIDFLKTKLLEKLKTFSNDYILKIL